MRSCPSDGPSDGPSDCRYMTRFFSNAGNERFFFSPVNGVKPPGTNCNKRFFDGF